MSFIAYMRLGNLGILFGVESFLVDRFYWSLYLLAGQSQMTLCSTTQMFIGCPFLYLRWLTNKLEGHI